MDDLRNRIRAFLAQHNTMTLATVDHAGAPQAAAVFYAADDAFDLFFLSSPHSRHSRALARDPRVAASIQADNQAWQTIQGLQIEGAARLVDGAAQTAHAMRIYASRFEFLRGLLDGVDGGPAALRGPLASSRFYVLRPAWIRLIDNTQGFGSKEELALE
jgi:uncharacterized protein YhbP (UPF0306 family)